MKGVACFVINPTISSHEERLEEIVLAYHPLSTPIDTQLYDVGFCAALLRLHERFEPLPAAEPRDPGLADLPALAPPTGQKKAPPLSITLATKRYVLFPIEKDCYLGVIFVREVYIPKSRRGIASLLGPSATTANDDEYENNDHEQELREREEHNDSHRIQRPGGKGAVREASHKSAAFGGTPKPRRGSGCWNAVSRNPLHDEEDDITNEILEGVVGTVIGVFQLNHGRIMANYHRFQRRAKARFLCRMSTRVNVCQNGSCESSIVCCANVPVNSPMQSPSLPHHTGGSQAITTGSEAPDVTQQKVESKTVTSAPPLCAALSQSQQQCTKCGSPSRLDDFAMPTLSPVELRQIRERGGRYSQKLLHTHLLLPLMACLETFCGQNSGCDLEAAFLADKGLCMASSAALGANKASAPLSHVALGSLVGRLLTSFPGTVSHCVISIDGTREVALSTMSVTSTKLLMALVTEEGPLSGVRVPLSSSLPVWEPDDNCDTVEMEGDVEDREKKCTAVDGHSGSSSGLLSTTALTSTHESMGREGDQKAVSRCECHTVMGAQRAEVISGYDAVPAPVTAQGGHKHTAAAAAVRSALKEVSGSFVHIDGGRRGIVFPQKLDEHLTAWLVVSEKYAAVPPLWTGFLQQLRELIAMSWSTPLHPTAWDPVTRPAASCTPDVAGERGQLWACNARTLTHAQALSGQPNSSALRRHGSNGVWWAASPPMGTWRSSCEIPESNNVGTSSPASSYRIYAATTEPSPQDMQVTMCMAEHEKLSDEALSGRRRGSETADPPTVSGVKEWGSSLSDTGQSSSFFRDAAVGARSPSPPGSYVPSSDAPTPLRSSAMVCGAGSRASLVATEGSVASGIQRPPSLLFQLSPEVLAGRSSFNSSVGRQSVAGGSMPRLLHGNPAPPQQRRSRKLPSNESSTPATASEFRNVFYHYSNHLIGQVKCSLQVATPTAARGRVRNAPPFKWLWIEPSQEEGDASVSSESSGSCRSDDETATQDSAAAHALVGHSLLAPISAIARTWETLSHPERLQWGSSNPSSPPAAKCAGIRRSGVTRKLGSRRKTSQFVNAGVGGDTSAPPSHCSQETLLRVVDRLNAPLKQGEREAIHQLGLLRYAVNSTFPSLQLNGLPDVFGRVAAGAHGTESGPQPQFATEETLLPVLAEAGEVVMETWLQLQPDVWCSLQQVGSRALSCVITECRTLADAEAKVSFASKIAFSNAMVVFGNR